MSPVSEGRPSRYDRSFGGLLAAMIVTVLFVAAYVGVRAFTREQPDIQPESVGYLNCVADLQSAGTTVAYPLQLPAGWIDTSVAVEPSEPPVWRIGMLTDREAFIGLVQQGEDVARLVSTYVDKAPTKGPTAAPENRLGATSWQTWSDQGGDHAYSTVLATGPLAGQTLLVYGSAPAADQEALIGLLTLDPVGEVAQGTPPCDATG
jgi:hypothetical protein